MFLEIVMTDMNFIMNNLVHIALRFVIVFALISPCWAHSRELQGLNAFDKEAYLQAFTLAKNNPEGIMSFDSNKSIVYYLVKTNSKMNYCVIIRRCDKKVFTGFADFNNPSSPKLCFGSIIYYASDPNNIIFERVRFDYDITFSRRIEDLPVGKYNFGMGVLLWAAEKEYKRMHPNYNYEYTADGHVKEVHGGYEGNFNGEDLVVNDYISFSGSGVGKAIQTAKSDGITYYSSTTKRYGPRGGYRAPIYDSGYVEYDVTITRTQPMRYSFNKENRLLKMSYSPTVTSTFKYENTTNHPVMAEIKGSYRKWAKLAPPRYTIPDAFFYMGQFGNFIVLVDSNDDINDISKYIFVPKAGQTTTISNPEYTFEKYEMEIGTTNILSDAYHGYNNYIK